MRTALLCSGPCGHWSLSPLLVARYVTSSCVLHPAHFLYGTVYEDTRRSLARQQGNFSCSSDPALSVFVSPPPPPPPRPRLCLSLSVSVYIYPLSLSLSLTHTHTHIHMVGRGGPQVTNKLKVKHRHRFCFRWARLSKHWTLYGTEYRPPGAESYYFFSPNIDPIIASFFTRCGFSFPKQGPVYTAGLGAQQSFLCCV